MKRKAVDMFLLLLIVVGAILAWQSGQERSRLLRQYQRLARITGEFPVVDTTRVNVLALETGEPLHFAWRVYTPPNYTQVLGSKSGGKSSTWSSGSGEFIARVRFRQNAQGDMEIYSNFSGGSSLSGFGNRALAELLRDRWDKIRVEQLGAAELTAIKPDRAAILLRLTLPEDMQQDARQRLSSYDQKDFVPVVYELTLGADATKP